MMITAWFGKTQSAASLLWLVDEKEGKGKTENFTHMACGALLIYDAKFKLRQ
jgi:hypothetical protein